MPAHSANRRQVTASQTSTASSNDEFNDAIRGAVEESNNSRSENNVHRVNQDFASVQSILREPIDFVLEPNNMIYFPGEFMNPLRMCCVTKNVICLKDGLIPQTGLELALFGIGESIPKHFQQMIWLMEMINRAEHITECAVGIMGKTRVDMLTRGKKEIVCGIEERFVPDPTMIHTQHYEQFPPSSDPIQTFSKMCMDEGVAQDTFVSKRNVELYLGIIPIEYTMDGETVRVVGQVLRVVPAVGFDLLRFLTVYCNPKNKTKVMPCADKKDWNDLWKKVLNHEMDHNLACKSLNALPNPSAVRSYSGTNSPAHILSPFLILEKILNNLPGTHCGQRATCAGYDPMTLKIAGFPRLTDPVVVKEFIEEARKRDQAYRTLLTQWSVEFSQLQPKEDNNTLSEIIPPGIGNDFIWTSLNFCINMGNSNESMEKFDGMQKVRLPAIAMAILGYLLSADSDESLHDCSLETFVRPFVKHQMDIATVTLMTETYDGIKNITADLPRAGMYGSNRRNFELTLDTLDSSSGNVGRLTEAYNRYLLTNLTFLARGERGNLFCSHRVLNTAEIIDMLKKRDIPLKIGDSLQLAGARMPEAMRTLEQKILFDEEMTVLYEILASMCLLNESAKLNPLNLSALFALVVSDVLSFLGAHQKTWIYKQFTVIVVGGNGHLRYNGYPWTAKRNSSGEGAKYKIWVFMLSGFARLCDGISNEVIASLEIRKITRITVPQLEGICAVTKADNEVISVPNANMLLSPIIFDEALRNLNADALNCLVTLLPRDAQQAALSLKTMEPEKNQPKRADGVVDRLEGMGPLVYCMSMNNNPSNAIIAEPIKSLLCAIHAVSPGAAKSTQEILDGNSNPDRKRKLNDQGVDMSEGVSTEPSDKDIRESVIWSLSVLPAISRRLALLNKVGLTNMEVSPPCLTLFNWFLSFILNHLNFTIGSTVFSDFTRLMQGYLSRGVGLSMLVTTAKHFRRCGVTYREASLKTIMDMESSAISLHNLHSALLSGLTRMLDCNLLWSNQIIARIIHAPVLDLEWFSAVLDDSIPIDNLHPDYNKLKRFLQNSQGAMMADYLTVPQLTSKTYLEKYCSIIKESFSTYCDMFTETASKKIDLECLLGIRNARLQHLCRRMGVAHDRDQRPDHENNDGSSVLWIQMESQATGKTVIKECYVNLVHHLWLLAVQGTCKLHAENSAVFAENLYAWICRRHIPSQFVPSGLILMDNFSTGATARPHVCVINRSKIMKNNHVLHDDARSYYMLRGKGDDSAWEKGRNLSEAPGFYEPYMLEDTVHMGALYQQWSLFRNTGIPPEFRVVPGLTARAPELKPTRVYPIRKDDGMPGTICIAPKGKSFVLVNFSGEALAIQYESWQMTLETSNIAVGPLVHRPNAVARLDSDELAVIMPRSDDAFESIGSFSALDTWEPRFNTVRMVHEPTYFLDAAGYYEAKTGEGKLVNIHFSELELVSVGTHIFVEIDIAKESIPANRFPADASHFTHVEGWLRYPDECSGTASDPELIYVAIRGAEEVEIHGFCADACSVIPPRQHDAVLKRLVDRV